MSFYKEDKSALARTLSPSLLCGSALCRMHIAPNGAWQPSGIEGAVCVVRAPDSTASLRIHELHTWKQLLCEPICEALNFQQLTELFCSFETASDVCGLELFDAKDFGVFHQAMKAALSGQPLLAEPDVTQTPTPSVPMMRPKQPPVAPVTPSVGESSSPPAPVAARPVAPSVVSPSSTGKKKRGFFSRIISAVGGGDTSESMEISGPTNVVHKMHMGFDGQSGEFKVENIPDEWKALFKNAGIRKKDLKDERTRNAVMGLVAQNLGSSKDDVMSQLQRPAPPKPPQTAPQAPVQHQPVPSQAPPQRPQTPTPPQAPPQRPQAPQPPQQPQIRAGGPRPPPRRPVAPTPPRQPAAPPRPAAPARPSAPTRPSQPPVPMRPVAPPRPAMPTPPRAPVAPTSPVAPPTPPVAPSAAPPTGPPTRPSSGPPDGRADLLSAIRGGAALSPVQSKEKTAPASVPASGGGDLLSAIRGGAKLRPVGERASSPSSNKPEAPALTGGQAATLQDQLKMLVTAMRPAMENDDGDDSDSDSDWD